MQRSLWESWNETNCLFVRSREEPVAIYSSMGQADHAIVQELCESRGGRPGLSVLTSLMVSVDVKLY